MVSNPQQSLSETCYFLGILQNMKDGLVVIKTILEQSRAEIPEEGARMHQLLGYAKDNSRWHITRLCTMNNFNKKLISTQSVTELGFMNKLVLDPTTLENVEAWNM